MITNLPQEVQRKFEYATSPVRSIPGVTVVIPIRGIERIPNLRYCVSRLLQQNVEPIEIIISEEDQREIVKLDDFRQDSRVRKIYTKSNGSPFNKCKAVNAGVVAATYKSILMNDADIILPRDYIFRVSNILYEYEACFIAKEIYNMDLLRFGVIWRGGKRSDYFTGGSIGFTKDAFYKIGGMNEKFVGYGSEDCEFWTRISTLCKLHESRDAPLLHLNHKRQHHYSQNGTVYDETIGTPMEVRVASLKEDLQKHIDGRVN
jgi:glycosyltransferase involved in cell wall biosynthesis